MSASFHGRPHPRTLCAMVQLHCWMPRTTDSVVMPFHSLAILTSALAAEALDVLGHVAENVKAKGTSAKPPDKKDKAPSDPASQANVFAAYLATAAASLSAVAPPAASTVKPSAPKGGSSKAITAPIGSLSLASSNPERLPPGLPLTSIPASAGSLPGAPLPATPAGAKNGALPAAKATQPKTAQSIGVNPGAKNGLPSAATGTSKLPSSPTATAPAASARVAAHATPDSIQTARASAASKSPAAATGKSSTSVAPEASAKPLSKEGKDEIHLGTHTKVESPLPEIASPDHAMRITANRAVSESSDPSPPEPQKVSEASSLAGAKVEPTATATAHLTAASTDDERVSAPSAASSVRSTASGAVARLFTATTPSATPAKSSTEPAVRLLDAPAPTHHDDTQSQTAAASSPDPGSSVTAALPDPTAAPASQPNASAAPTVVPVADQLTRAIVAQADVIQRDGQTNVHLRLDPPHLGSVQIHLTATEHTVSARIVVAHEGTRQLLEGTAHHLREGLAGAGLSLGSFDVARDGGGWGGGQQAPPQTPWSPPPLVSTPRASTVVAPIVSRPTDGINILA